MIKIWLDDERPTPDNTWLLCRRAEEATSLLRSFHESGIDVHISLDHDLGESKELVACDGLASYSYGSDSKTGYDVAKFIEKRAAQGIKPPAWEIHSANPVGRARIAAALESADRIYNDSFWELERND